jgi:hypothetical protein
MPTCDNSGSCVTNSVKPYICVGYGFSVSLSDRPAPGAAGPSPFLTFLVTANRRILATARPLPGATGVEPELQSETVTAFYSDPNRSRSKKRYCSDQKDRTISRCRMVAAGLALGLLFRINDPGYRPSRTTTVAEFAEHWKGQVLF